MKVTALKIPDVKLIEPDVFEDERGFFYESFNQQKFNKAIGQDITFVQTIIPNLKKGCYEDCIIKKNRMLKLS